MAALILPSQRVIQPQGPVGIDWSNPLTRKLALAVIGGVPVDLVSGRLASLVNGPTVEVNAGGRAWRSNATSSRLDFTANALDLNTNEWSVATIFAQQSATTNAYLIAKQSTDGWHILNFSGGYLNFWWSAPASANFSYSFTPEIGRTYQVSASSPPDGASDPALARMYLDRAYIERSGGIAASMSAGSSKTISIGNRTAAPARPFDGSQALVLVWNRALSDVEHRAWQDNPWQIFKPMSRRIWAPASAPAGQSLTAQAGSYALTGLASTLKAARSLTGSAGSLSLAGSSATLKLGRALSASAGAYSLSGQPATLTRYTPGSGTSYALTAEPGQYRMQGQRAEMAVGMQMVHGWAAPGTAWHALLSPPTRRRLRQIEEEAPEVAQAIEEAAQAAVVQPATSVEPPDFGAIDRRKRETRAAYETFFRNLVDEIRQADEDEQIMRVMAQLL